MDPGILRELAATMREMGVTRLKTPDVEIEMGTLPASDSAPTQSPQDWTGPPTTLAELCRVAIPQHPDGDS